MKNLYPKSKGKIHPSPAPTAAANGDALSVLNLLPAAILALTAALAFEDKEVVAYLMLQSIKATAEERRRCRTVDGVRRPLFDCGCFECYTSFWSRWDSSKDREAIHQVIEAFEEHLAREEMGREGKEKRKRRKGKDERRAKKEERAEAAGDGDGAEKSAVLGLAEESKGFEEGAVSVSEGCVAEKEVDVGSAAVSGERRRGWADVVGLFNSPLWNLWGPGA